MNNADVVFISFIDSLKVAAVDAKILFLTLTITPDMSRAGEDVSHWENLNFSSSVIELILLANRKKL